ncbi:hypothetical protein QVD17_36821 [Tagetes erecta]|uniref:Uncharacterized protein n=1 Tax=Tagetes erecta TaxID=13708 RepID=A0AAD8JVD3_TARER|nr:hypothetical protein QVD17_36821 [Tagetes erecta]
MFNLTTFQYLNSPIKKHAYIGEKRVEEKKNLLSLIVSLPSLIFLYITSVRVTLYFTLLACLLAVTFSPSFLPSALIFLQLFSSKNRSSFCYFMSSFHLL